MAKLNNTTSPESEAKTVKVKYSGKTYEVESTYPFNDRTYYRLKGVPHGVSERLIEN